VRARERRRCEVTAAETNIVVELASSLASTVDMSRLHLITRRAGGLPPVDDTTPNQSKNGNKARIVRPKQALRGLHRPKESTLPHLDTLGGQLFELMYQQPRLPDIIHTHYADALLCGWRCRSPTPFPLTTPPPPRVISAAAEA